MYYTREYSYILVLLNDYSKSLSRTNEKHNLLSCAVGLIYLFWFIYLFMVSSNVKAGENQKMWQRSLSVWLSIASYSYLIRYIWIRVSIRGTGIIDVKLIVIFVLMSLLLCYVIWCTWYIYDSSLFHYVDTLVIVKCLKLISEFWRHYNRVENQQIAVV